MKRETWLSTKEAAELLEITPRSIRRKISDGEFIVDTRKNDKNREVYYIAYSSLPTLAKRKYQRERRKQANVNIETTIAGLKDWQREHVTERLQIVKGWEALAEQKETSKAAIVDEYLEMVKEKKLSKTTLYRWLATLDKSGPAGLAPRWNNGREKFADDSFAPEAKNFIHDAYLRLSQPTMKDVYRKLRARASRYGWNIPGYETVREYRHLKIPKDVDMLERHGRKMYDDRAVPDTIRDVTCLAPYELIEGDHHQMDCACLMPDGKVIFPWLTAWRDPATGKVMSWALVSQPSSDSINYILRKMILKYGLPGEVFIDNGKDYKARRFMGTKKDPGKINQGLEGLYKLLGIEVTCARNYNGKEKTIENWFKVLEDEFGKYQKGYRGKNTLNRPEGVDKKLKNKDVMTFAELERSLGIWIEQVYNNQRPYYGAGAEGRTPNEIFYANPPVKYEINEVELSFLCAPWPHIKTVGKNGIRHNNVYYENTKYLYPYFGKKVTIRIIDDDIDNVYVFNADGKYICKATAIEPVKRGKKNTDVRALELAGLRKAEAKKQTKQWKTDNLSNRMSDEEYAKLPTEGAGDPRYFQETELLGVPLETRYREAVEEQEKRELEEIEESKNRIEALRKYQKYEPVEKQPTTEEQVYNWLVGINTEAR